MGSPRGIFKFGCPHCGTEVSSRSQLAGTKTTCQQCGEIITVPSRPETPGTVIEKGCARVAQAFLHAASEIHKGISKGAERFDRTSGNQGYGCGFVVVLVLLVGLAGYFVFSFIGC